MKNIGIFYFSGTGNTELLCHVFKERFPVEVGEVDLFPIEQILLKKVNIDYEKYNLFGFAFPVHAFNAPRIFYDFIEELPVIKSVNCFIIKNSADRALYGGSTTLMRKKLKEKGYNLTYEKLVLMVSNLVVRPDEKEIKRIFGKAEKQISIIISELISNKKQLYHYNFFNDITSKLSSFFEDRFMTPFFAKKLYSSEKCIHCGKCFYLCPTHNVRETDGDIHFGSNCLMCMRCVYSCPVNAIEIKGIMKKMKIKSFTFVKDIVKP